MTANFDLNVYKCRNPPQIVWRVTHSGSQSRQDPITHDLVASDTNGTFSDESELKQAIAEHINWRSRQPSCFLSVFSDYGHARNWAEQRERTGSAVYIHEISTAMLPTDACVLDLNSLTAKLGIVHPFATHEFLILCRISARSLVNTTGLEEMLEQGPQLSMLLEMCLANNHKEANSYHYAARQFNPHYHWVSELHGYYDTDEECEELNKCDDFLKMLEGD